ncbi:MAG: dUTP diphosphatase [Gammaproteobacteria bacterium]
MNEPLSVEVKITDARAEEFLPQYATDGAAGMDLRACLDAPRRILPGETQIVGTGIAVSIVRPDYMALLAPRSGLGTKHGIILANTVGIIDSDYQNEIRAALYNRGKDAYEIAPGERICQLIFLPVSRAALKTVREFSQNTARGLGGFGSTGRF